MENKTFEDFLEQYFIDLGESGGVAITKDNVEDMFDRWLQDLDVEDMLRYGELYGKYQFLAGKESILLNK